MMKEIHEQPTRCPGYAFPAPVRTARSICPSWLWTEDAIREHLTASTSSACGSAYHVGMAARICDRKPGPPAGGGRRRQRVPLPQPRAGAGFSRAGHQPESGETADTLAALRLCQGPRRAHSWASSTWWAPALPARLTTLLYTCAGPEDLRGHHQGLQHPAGSRATCWPPSLPACAAPWPTASTTNLVVELEDPARKD